MCKDCDFLLVVQGEWKKSSSCNTIVDPLNGGPFIKVAEVDERGLQLFVDSLAMCPKYGLHNPFKSSERYLLYGDISAKAAQVLSHPEVSDFFIHLIQRVAPKSYQQALGEVTVTQKFLENFSGDQGWAWSPEGTGLYKSVADHICASKASI